MSRHKLNRNDLGIGFTLWMMLAASYWTLWQLQSPTFNVQLILGLGIMLLAPLAIFAGKLTKLIAPLLAVYLPIVLFLWMRSQGVWLWETPQGGIFATLIISMAAFGAGTFPFYDEIRRALPWMLVAGVLGGTIAFLSGGAGNADPMREWFIQTFQMSYDQAYSATFFTRKAIHFFFYGALAYFAGRAGLRAAKGWPMAAIFGGLWSLSHAIFDEWRQSFVLSRSGKAEDVLLDLAGILVFLGFLGWQVKREKVDSSTVLVERE